MYLLIFVMVLDSNRLILQVVVNFITKCALMHNSNTCNMLHNTYGGVIFNTSAVLNLKCIPTFKKSVMEHTNFNSVTILKHCLQHTE